MRAPRLLKLVTAVAAVSFFGTPIAAGPPAVDFVDTLTGPDSPALSIPFDKFALTPAGLVRTNSGSGTANGIDRPIVKTVSGRYLSRDFVFEVDVTIPPSHGDIAYVGFGAARPNRVHDNEPTSAFLFRIHNLPDMPFYAIDIAVGVPSGGAGFRGYYRSLDRLGPYTPGRPMRFRIERRGANLTMSIPDLAGQSREFSLPQFVDLFDSSNAYLFLSNSSEGTAFNNLSVKAP